MLVKRTVCLSPPQLTLPPVRRNRAKSPEWNVQEAVERQFEQARRAWLQYQATRQRDAVYGYLETVFKVVRRWTMLGHTRICSLHALRTTRNSRAIRTRDPFSIVILCTSDARVVDAKTRSKWSRCLRHANRFKPNDQSLTSYIQAQGGINNCAHQWESR